VREHNFGEEEERRIPPCRATL
jgi:hypothetical protein